MIGTYALSAGYYDAYYGQAQRVRTLIRRDFDAAFERRRRAAPADGADGGVPARRQARRPAARCTRTTSSRCPSTSPACPASRCPTGSARACRRACRSSARRSPRTGCCEVGHALERALGFDPVPAAAEGARMSASELGARHRPRDPRPAGDADEDVLPLPEPLRRPAEHQRLPDLPRRTPGCCRCPTARPCGSRSASAWRWAARSPSVLQVGPQELLLSGQPQGVPDQPVRPAAVRRRPLPRARPGGRLRGRHRARAPRGGRREDGARGRRRRAHRRVVRLAWSTSTARGTPLLEIVTEPDLHSPEQARRFLNLLRATIVRHRRLRLRHGEGLAALRRQRLRAAASGRPSSAPRPSSRT